MIITGNGDPILDPTGQHPATALAPLRKTPNPSSWRSPSQGRDADYTLKWIFRREMRPIAFVDLEAFHSTNLAKLPTSRLHDNFRRADPLIGGGAGLPTTWRYSNNKELCGAATSAIHTSRRGC